MHPDLPRHAPMNRTAGRRTRLAARTGALLACVLGGATLLATPATADNSTGGIRRPLIVTCSTTVTTPGGIRIGVPCPDPCMPVSPLCDPVPPTREPFAP